MPTTRIRRRRSPQQGVSDMQWALLRDENIPKNGGILDDFQQWAFYRDDLDETAWRQPTGRQLWAAHGAEVLRGWIVENPGTRPSCWWRFDAPEHRQRVGGVGAAWGNHQMACGVPLVWVTQTNRTWWGGASGPAIDPKNPPLFESQATFLVDRR
jgi:hypothetical protein